MLSDILRDGFTTTNVFGLISLIFVIFCSMPVHEAAHAFAAYKLGDNTAKYQGRLSLDPLRHIDPVGASLLLLFGFGWAKPVPINPGNFKNAKRGMALSALAGPVSNLLMAVILALVANIILPFVTLESDYMYMLWVFFVQAAYVNISLAVFNLIPVPPLDGSRLLSAFLPDRLYYKLMMNEQYFMLIVIVLLVTGLITTPLGYLTDLIFDGIDYITFLPVSLFLH